MPSAFRFNFSQYLRIFFVFFLFTRIAQRAFSGLVRAGNASLLNAAWTGLSENLSCVLETKGVFVILELLKRARELELQALEREVLLQGEYNKLSSSFNQSFQRTSPRSSFLNTDWKLTSSGARRRPWSSLSVFLLWESWIFLVQEQFCSSVLKCFQSLNRFYFNNKINRTLLCKVRSA